MSKKTDKTNYRTPQPTPDIQKELEGIRDEVNNLPARFTAEIKGWWIWVDGKITGLDDEILREKSFRLAKSGKNAGKYYYKHPMAPRSRRGYYKRGNNAKTQSKQSKQEDNKPAFKVGFSDKTKRQMLEDELASVNNLIKVDSGENYINLLPMKEKVEKQLAELDDQEPKEELPLQDACNNTCQHSCQTLRV